METYISGNGAYKFIDASPCPQSTVLTIEPRISLKFVFLAVPQVLSALSEMEHNFSKKHFSLIFCLYAERLFVRFHVFTAVSTKTFFGNLFNDAFSVTILYSVDNSVTYWVSLVVLHM
jgi:hypothetical protein